MLPNNWGRMQKNWRTRKSSRDRWKQILEKEIQQRETRRWSVGFGGDWAWLKSSKVFFVTVEDRKAATLIPLIKKWTLPGTTMLSDCWKRTVQKDTCTKQWITALNLLATRACIRTTESRWNAVKKLLPRYGTRKQLYDSYFKEYCVRRKNLNHMADPLVEFLRLITKVYRQSDYWGWQYCWRTKWWTTFVGSRGQFQPGVGHKFIGRLWCPVTCSCNKVVIRRLVMTVIDIKLVNVKTPKMRENVV